MEWTFGSVFWALTAFFFWFSLMWMAIVVISDVFGRDMSGWAKAGWVVLVIFLPLIGSMIYFIARPSGAEQATLWPAGSRSKRRSGQVADEIGKAAQLYDQGRITADEYETLKSQALAG